MDERYFRDIFSEMIEENLLACGALFEISEVVFCDEVPTLPVTIGSKPKLLVNLDFIKENCLTEAEVKAVIIHKFLHVLLAHTENFDKITPALNLALDAVINAIIHRKFGPEYSSFMQRYYAREEGSAGYLSPLPKGKGIKLTIEILILPKRHFSLAGRPFMKEKW